MNKIDVVRTPRPSRTTNIIKFDVIETKNRAEVNLYIVRYLLLFFFVSCMNSYTGTASKLINIMRCGGRDRADAIRTYFILIELESRPDNAPTR